MINHGKFELVVDDVPVKSYCSFNNHSINHLLKNSHVGTYAATMQHAGSIAWLCTVSAKELCCDTDMKAFNLQSHGIFCLSCYICNPKLPVFACQVMFSIEGGCMRWIEGEKSTMCIFWEPSLECVAQFQWGGCLVLGFWWDGGEHVLFPITVFFYYRNKGN